MFGKFLMCMAITVGLTSCTTLPPLPPPTNPLPLRDLSAPGSQLLELADVLGPEDVLKVVIYGHPDLSQEVTIGRDGTFVYPLLGTVRTAKLSPPQLEAQMTQRLAQDFLVNPQLTITVTQRRNRQAYVLGAVGKPGVYPLKYNMTLLELISAAGGLSEEAGPYALLVRGDPESNGSTQSPSAESIYQNAVSIDLDKFLAGEIRPELYMHPNDTVYVVKRAYIFVTGQVQKPGRYPLERDTTARKAIILAGGFTNFAAKSRLQVRRTVDGESRDYRADLDARLQAEDVLVVPESIF